MLRLSRRRFLGLTASVLAAACGSDAADEPAPQPSATAAAAGATGTSSPANAAPGSEVRLRYIAGSAAKVEQVIGDFDNQTKQPTLNQTGVRFGVRGTDLGNSFEHNGNVYFVFGDVNAPFAPDPVAFSASTNPDGPLLLDFLTDAQGRMLRVLPAGVNMGPFEVNSAGLSLGGVLYVVVKTNFTEGASTDKSVLVRYNEAARSFTAVREISKLPAGRFIKMTLRHLPDGLAGLPSAGPHVLMFGSGEHRKSNAYLAAIPAAGFTTGEGTRYFAGMNGSTPRWSDKEADAAPIVEHPQIGDISVIHVPQLGVWVMTYDSRDPPGLIMRYAPRPWGPWSDAQIMFNAQRDRAVGAFIHGPNIRPDDGLAGPVAGQNDPATTPGAAYAPYMIERFTRVESDRLTLQYLISTWNPYVVVRMRSSFAVERV